MSGEDDILKLLEMLLTAEIFNQNQNLDANDLTPECRELFGVNGTSEVRRPLYVSEGMVRKSLGIGDACQKLQSNPVVSCEEFGQRIHITALEPAARWFIKKGGEGLVEKTLHLPTILRTMIQQVYLTSRSGRKTRRLKIQRSILIQRSQELSGRTKSSVLQWTL